MSDLRVFDAGIRKARLQAHVGAVLRRIVRLGDGVIAGQQSGHLVVLEAAQTLGPIAIETQRVWAGRLQLCRIQQILLAKARHIDNALLAHLTLRSSYGTHCFSTWIVRKIQ